MTVMTSYPPGTFCWVDLATSDLIDARAFYAALFGWEFDDRPVMPGMTYTVCRHGNFELCALHELGPEALGKHIPSHWASHISVTDADRTATLAVELGATLLSPPHDVGDAGRLAVIRDPTGGIVGLWQPGKHVGATLVNEPGALCWNELQTHDTARAEAFYTRLFGWQASHSDAGEVRYTEFVNGEHAAGGMLQLQPEWGLIPPHWLAYFAVADCDEAAGLAAELGGSVCVEPRDIPGVGRFCVLQDRQGAAFAVIRLLHPD
jgi:predicted enzyme related to lactoylglutathione lyase